MVFIDSVLDLHYTATAVASGHLVTNEQIIFPSFVLSIDFDGLVLISPADNYSLSLLSLSLSLFLDAS